MKPTLAPGLSDTHSYTVTAANTVPHLASVLALCYGSSLMVGG